MQIYVIRNEFSVGYRDGSTTISGCVFLVGVEVG